MNERPLCRFCGHALDQDFIDLGCMPLANSYVRQEHLASLQPFPLHAYVCPQCLLVQVEQMQAPEQIFSDYAYFSSYSSSWLKHCEMYCDDMIRRFSLGPETSVVELASNDGYLLQYFQQRELRVLGVEPAANVAEAARKKGIPTVTEFFGAALAHRLVPVHGKADVIVANNVLAHVPDLNDFVEGMQILLAEGGVITIEFPHLLNLIRFNQFDTIYHEHFSYFSFHTAKQVLEAHGLRVFDVETLQTHGGSLRIYAAHQQCDVFAQSGRIQAVLDGERVLGMDSLEGYRGFQEQAERIRRAAADFIAQALGSGKAVAGYGAAAKANTFLNFCGLSRGKVAYIADKSPHKQGLYMPGSGIPVVSPEYLLQERPDYVIIFPWNLKDEITAELEAIRAWGGRFVTFIPELRVF